MDELPASLFLVLLLRFQLIVVHDVFVHGSHHDHGNHARQEQHDHQRVDYRKPVDLVVIHEKIGIPAWCPFDFTGLEVWHGSERVDFLDGMKQLRMRAHTMKVTSYVKTTSLSASTSCGEWLPGMILELGLQVLNEGFLSLHSLYSWAMLLKRSKRKQEWIIKKVEDMLKSSPDQWTLGKPPRMPRTSAHYWGERKWSLTEVMHDIH